MNKYKIIIFILIIVLCSSIIGYPYIGNLLISDEDKADEITILKGEYIVGEEINQGQYDVEVLKGKVKFMQRELSIKDKILGLKLNKGEHIIIEGKGEIKLSPSSFQIINRNKSGQYEFSHSGFYKIGAQIPAGEYILRYKGKIEKEKPFVQILSSKQEVLNTYDFIDKESYEITLEKSDILEVNKYLFFESDSIIITLKPN
jgi:hypothetical protein